MIDVHGQANNNYTQFGYYISNTKLSQTNSELDTYAHLSSINSLISNNYPHNLSDVIRGEYSMGTLLENIQNVNNPTEYLVVPSMKKAYLTNEDGRYYSGGFSLSTHGSMISNGGNIDVIQIEMPSDIRFSRKGWDRDIFCHDFAKVIKTFINKWYNINSTCFNDTQIPTTTTDPINATTTAPTNNITTTTNSTEINTSIMTTTLDNITTTINGTNTTTVLNTNDAQNIYWLISIITSVLIILN